MRNRKGIFGLIILGELILSGCEENVYIQNLPFETKPVIYALIDPNDTIHSIRVERFFSGDQPPAITATNPDSLYFSDVKVSVSLTGVQGIDGCTLEAECIQVDNKEPGYFGYPRHYLYQFKKVMKMDGRNLYSWVAVRVEIPGLPDAECKVMIINPIKIWSPNPKGQFVYLVRDRPLLIQWSGGSWNEVDIRFEIQEQYADSISTKALQFQKVNDVQINGKYYEIKIPYDLVVQGIEKNFIYRKDIIRRYFGKVNIIISTGQEEYANYIQFQGGINDFNLNPFSNIENGLGLFSSKSSVQVGPMVLDQASRFELASDPVLKKLSFIEY